jgi:hypothetical protein
MGRLLLNWSILTGINDGIFYGTSGWIWLIWKNVRNDAEKMIFAWK